MISDVNTVSIYSIRETVMSFYVFILLQQHLVVFNKNKLHVCLCDCLVKGVYVVLKICQVLWTGNKTTWPTRRH